MKRIAWLSFVTIIGAIAFYVSRFWTLTLWDRSGLFGWDALRPQGSLLGRWLRGTDFAPFELLIWAVAVFAVLTILQKLYDKMSPPPGN